MLPSGLQSAAAPLFIKGLRYGLYAPVYDWVAKPFESGRKSAIERVEPQADDRILIHLA